MKSIHPSIISYLFGLLISSACIIAWGIWHKWPQDKIKYHLIPWVLSYSAYMVLFIGDINWKTKASFSTCLILPVSMIVACILAIKLKWTNELVSISVMIMIPWVVYMAIGIMALPIWFSLLLALLLGLFANRYTKKYAESLTLAIEGKKKGATTTQNTDKDK